MKTRSFYRRIANSSIAESPRQTSIQRIAVATPSPLFILKSSSSSSSSLSAMSKEKEDQGKIHTNASTRRRKQSFVVSLTTAIAVTAITTGNILPTTAASTGTIATTVSPINLSSFIAPNTNSNKRKLPSSDRWKVIAPETPTSLNAKKVKKKTDGTTKSTTAIKTNNKTPLTQSFDAKWAGNIESLKDQDIELHTLILGTHPSVKSLEEQQYYGHPMNAFWWIAGDCLGFRRDNGISVSTGKPYQLTSSLRHNNIIPYDKQIETLCSKGFALWDVVKSCNREGSLDADIQNELPNDIRTFCNIHPTISRIVFSNGGTACQIFRKHFIDWLDSGELIPASNTASQQVFKKWIVNKESSKTKKVSSTSKAKTKKSVTTTNTAGSKNTDNDHIDDTNKESRKITLISAIAVSPAAAKYPYTEKRDFWEEYVYAPGLKDFENKKRKKE